MKIKFNPIADSKLAYFPKKYANQGVVFYLISLAACTILFMTYAMPAYIFVMGIISVLLFFLGGNSLGRQWSGLIENNFLKKVFWVAFAIRIIYAIIIWFLNKNLYGTFYESNAGDILWYIPAAMRSVQEYNGNIFEIIINWQRYASNIADVGYQTYLAFLFAIQGAAGTVKLGLTDKVYIEAAESYLFLPMALKAVYGALTCVLMYKVAKRHFGDNVARMTAIFCMLQWNLIWWCGSFMKEAEMIFLSTLFVERMDRTLMGINVKPHFIVITVLIGFIIFTFRSALFMTAVAASGLTMILQKNKQFTLTKKIIVGAVFVGAMALAVGETVMEQVQEVATTAQDTSYQKTNMEWRTQRDDGNKFAKYAGAAVFAPLIFTIPFPNMVYTTLDQEMQLQVNGGNFEKNVLSFFIIFAMFQLLISGQWRQHVFPIAYYVGYLMALVLSVFAQSGRFHMPILPFAMMFGAYGLTLVTSKQHKKWFSYALVVEVAFCVFWSWFKLAGRGYI